VVQLKQNTTYNNVTEKLIVVLNSLYDSRYTVQVMQQKRQQLTKTQRKHIRQRSTGIEQQMKLGHAQQACPLLDTTT